MKKITFLITLFIGLQVVAFSQSCLPDGITFNNQTAIDNFQVNHPNCTEIEGYVNISGSNITNLDGLNVITSIGEYLTIDDNASLTSISGLSNLTHIEGELEINYNTSLTSLTGLESITALNNDFWLIGNTALVNLSGLDSLTTVGGDFTLAYEDLITNLTGLGGLEMVSGELSIAKNDALLNLEGLTKLSSIGDNLIIYQNPGIINLNGIESLASVGRIFQIFNNVQLTSLSGIESLTSIADGLFINSNYELEDISGLNNVTLVGGKLIIKMSQKLASLNGLGNIAAESIDSINISGNPMLTTCHVKSICDFIATPNAVVYINNNAAGCNNIAEVDSACQSLSVPEMKFSDYYSIYPVPAHDRLHITAINNTFADLVTVFNQFGQRVIVVEPESNLLDVSGLAPGMYVIEFQNNGIKLREKLLIK